MSKPDVKPETKDAVRYVPASESRFSASAEFTFPLTSYIPEHGTPLEHLSRPEYWANIKALKAGVRIFVFAEDESYWAELLVRKVGQGYARVQLLRHGTLDEALAEPALTKDYEVQFKGPLTKHRVVRLKDGHVLKDKLDTELAAQAWLRDHLRMLAA